MVALIKSGARSTGVSPKLKICIISSYPEGLAPYERSELSKECLRPSDAHHRDWQVCCGGVGSFVLILILYIYIYIYVSIYSMCVCTHSRNPALSS